MFPIAKIAFLFKLSSLLKPTTQMKTMEFELSLRVAAPSLKVKWRLPPLCFTFGRGAKYLLGNHTVIEQGKSGKILEHSRLYFTQMNDIFVIIIVEKSKS